jgi:hypothetical protein
MTGRTILFKRTGTISLVAAGTLLVKGIGTFRRFFIPFIGVMAFTARLCIGILVLVKGMMTITA